MLATGARSKFSTPLAAAAEGSLTQTSASQNSAINSAGYTAGGARAAMSRKDSAGSIARKHSCWSHSHRDSNSPQRNASPVEASSWTGTQQQEALIR
jgi:hypothetical protein